MSRSNDLLALIRGLQLVTEASINLQKSYAQYVWRNSSIPPLVQEQWKSTRNGRRGDSPKTEQNDSNKNFNNIIYESTDRIATVLHGIREYSRHSSFGPDFNNTYFNNAVHNLKHSLNELEKSDLFEKKDADGEIKLTERDRQLLKQLEMEHQRKMQKEQEKDESKAEKQEKVAPNSKNKLQLSENSKQRTVPSSRIGRMVSFGTLAAGLGLGTAAEYAKRTLGFAESSDPTTLFLNQSNLDRIVDTLCKVRGAALKLGQLLSIQDDSVINPELSKALERVRKSADFMPNWQVEQVMSGELGPTWRSKFVEFAERPFAAASIGQVHLGKIADGREVAVKIQYPGVAKGIESDIDNLGGIMKLWNVFPKGMFLDNVMKVAKRELAWEVDYTREAICTRKFRELLRPYPQYYVPEVIDDVSTKQVFTTELLDGVPVDQCFDMPEEDRRFIAEKIIELVLLELLEFRYMQTDPNWANFLYDPIQKRILLLDFGASREYSQAFMNQYVRILKGACDNDRETVLKYSKDIGFLTGYESKLMEEAHVDAVMIMGEVFRAPEGYDFSGQDMTARIQNLVPTMVSHRLCPPPEEVYSLHRKLSGVFLLCAKLKTRVRCRAHFLRLYEKYYLNL